MTCEHCGCDNPGPGNLEGLNHLPADVARALQKYEDDVAAGRISFDEQGHAVYPGRAQADASLAEHVAAHTHSLPSSVQQSGEPGE